VASDETPLLKGPGVQRWKAPSPFSGSTILSAVSAVVFACALAFVGVFLVSIVLTGGANGRSGALQNSDTEAQFEYGEVADPSSYIHRIDIPVYLSVLDGDPIPGRGREAIKSKLGTKTKIRVVEGVRGMDLTESDPKEMHRQVWDLLANGVESLTHQKKKDGFRKEKDGFTEESAWGDKKFVGNWGALGCTLSHLKVIKQAFDDGVEVAMIVEDDMDFGLAEHWKVSLSDYVSKLPQGWGVVQLSPGITEDQMKDLSQQWKKQGASQVSVMQVPERFFGTGAMLISHAGMSQMLNAYMKEGKFDLSTATCFEMDVCMYFEGVSNMYVSMPPMLVNLEDNRSEHYGKDKKTLESLKTRQEMRIEEQARSALLWLQASMPTDNLTPLEWKETESLHLLGLNPGAVNKKRAEIALGYSGVISDVDADCDGGLETCWKYDKMHKAHNVEVT